MDIFTNKMLIISLTLATMILLFRCWVQISFVEFRRRMPWDSSTGKDQHQKAKFFIQIASNHRLHMVYIDNDHVENLSVQKTFQTADSNKSGLDSVDYYVPNYSGMVKDIPNNIERDETIDYNYNENDVGNKRKTCSREDPWKTIVLVKCRHYDNEPFTNIMYRYGDLNQLTFALAKRTSFQSYWPMRFHPSFVDTSLLFTNRVHMLINSPYQHSTMKRYMAKDAVFIAVIYDPIKVHLSNLVERFSLQSYKLKTRIIQKLYEKDNVLDGQYTFNTIAGDLGYPSKQFNRSLTPNEFINELEKQFDVVLIGDYVDESLVVLKNMLCWSLSDFAFIPSKKEDFFPDMSNRLKIQIKTRNKVDQTIYEHFNQTFWKKIQDYGPTFSSDLEELKSLKLDVKQDCSGRARTLGFTGDKGNIEPLCKRIQWTEHDYISYLKRKPPLIANEITDALKYLHDSLYTFYNTTSKEILRLQSL